MTIPRGNRWLRLLPLVLVGCGGLSVVDVQVADNPSLVLEKVFSVTLSDPAALAVRCTRDDLPSEIHLVESVEPAVDHELRVQGLLAQTTYSCIVAPVDVARSTASEIDFTTAELPAAMPSATTESNGEPGAAYTLMPHQRLIDGELSIRLVLMDNDGALRWYYTLPIEGYADMGAEYFGDGLFLWGGVGLSEAGDGAPRLVSVSHEEVYRADYPGAAESRFHHMADQQYDGTVVTLVEEEVNTDDAEWTGFAVHRVDVHTDELLWSWSQQQALDSGEVVPDYESDWGVNWAGVAVDEAGDEIMVLSLCQVYLVVAIDMSSGSLIWSLGEEGSLDLTEGDHPECQHGLDIDGQRLLLYDNGAAPTTRAVEYAIDAAAGTAAETWSWTEDGWREPAWGDVDYLGEDRVVIARGHLAGWGDGLGPTQVVEVDRSDGSVVWRLSFTDLSDAVFSADSIDGCELFAEVSRCPALATRLEELSPWFGVAED